MLSSELTASRGCPKRVCHSRPAQAPPTKRVPVYERTSLFGISALAISSNGSPVQCSGNVIDVDFLQRRDGLMHIVFFVSGKVESADDRGTFLMPEAAGACLIALTTPGWLREVNTTNPRPFSLVPELIRSGQALDPDMVEHIAPFCC
jgi:hypothetical protein